MHTPRTHPRHIPRQHILKSVLQNIIRIVRDLRQQILINIRSHPSHQINRMPGHFRPFRPRQQSKIRQPAHVPNAVIAGFILVVEEVEVEFVGHSFAVAFEGFAVAGEFVDDVFFDAVAVED